MSAHTFRLTAMSFIFLLSTSLTLQANDLFKNLQSTTSIGPTLGIIIKNTCSKKEASCEGHCTWSDGRIYVGEFEYGIPSGWGKLTYADGATYQGQFKGGERHGEGNQTLSNGDRYAGEWSKGLMSGNGSYYWENGNYYEGQFANDKMEGKGTINIHNGEHYTGSWKGAKADGEGTYVLVDGTKYMGHFKSGKRHGQGVITWVTGDVLMGAWAKGNLQKSSAFTFTNGDSYVVSWKKGLTTNKGVYTLADTQREINGDILAVSTATKSDEDIYESVSPNIALVLYAIALEFKFNKDFNSSKHYIEMAQTYVPASSDLNRLLYAQLEIVEEKLTEM